MNTESVSISGPAPTRAVPSSRRKVWLSNLLATFIGLVVGLVISEIGLSFFQPPPNRWYYPQPLHLPDKELGWVMTPNQHSYTHDNPVTTNSLGLRSAEIDPQKQPGDLRIISL